MMPRPEVVPGSERAVLSTPVWSYETRDILFPNDQTRTFHTVRKGPGVTIVPWMKNDSGSLDVLDSNLLMIPQARPNAGNKIGWCFPAGGIDDIDEGSVEACASRELAEEAGAVAEEGFVDLGSEFTAVHFSDNLNTTVLAKGVTLGESAIELTESIGTPRVFSIGEIYEMTQRISSEGLPYVYDGITIAGLAKAALYIATKNSLRS